MRNSKRVRIREVNTLSDDWYLLRKTTFDYLMGDGSWKTVTRETYDRGNGATCAGLLDNQSPEEAIRREAEEELGVKVGEVHKVLETYMSPGSVTEKLLFFVADYDSPAGEVAGNSEEGEDIEVVELGLDEALDWIDNGRIQDAKTIILLLLAQTKNWFGRSG